MNDIWNISNFLYTILYVDDTSGLLNGKKLYMCTYSQLKKNTKNFVQPRQGVNGVPYVPKLYASSGKDISKCIEGGSMKLATQVDYVYM